MAGAAPEVSGLGVGFLMCWITASINQYLAPRRTASKNEACGRRQRASAGAAGRGATRAETAAFDGPCRAGPRPALGFEFCFGW
jgi:hypothetical protein